MQPAHRRLVLLAVLVVFSAAQIYNTFFLDGGIVGKYGFLEAFPIFFTMSMADPLLAAGLVDFMTVAGILAVWLIADLPRERRWGPKTWLWLVSYVVFPGLGMLLYFLWLYPEHRFVRGVGAA
jgi:hypothetical protein